MHVLYVIYILINRHPGSSRLNIELSKPPHSSGKIFENPNLSTSVYIYIYFHIFINIKYIYIYSFIYIHTYINIYIYICICSVPIVGFDAPSCRWKYPSRSLRHPLSEAKDASTNSRGTVPDRSDRLFRHRAVYAIWYMTIWKIRVWAKKQRCSIWLFYQEKWINMVENHDQTRKQWGSGCFFIMIGDR